MTARFSLKIRKRLNRNERRAVIGAVKKLAFAKKAIDAQGLTPAKSRISEFFHSSIDRPYSWDHPEFNGLGSSEFPGALLACDINGPRA
jgi:hypothetical protein